MANEAGNKRLSDRPLGIVDMELARVRPLNRIGSVQLEYLAGEITNEEAAEKLVEIIENA